MPGGQVALRFYPLFCGLRQLWEQVDSQFRLQLVHTDHIPMQAALDLVEVGGQKGEGCRVCTKVKHGLPTVFRDAHGVPKFVQDFW